MRIRDMLYVLWQKITGVKTVPITPLVGANYENYGNSYYRVWGKHVQIHLGLQNVPKNTASTVFIMPEGLRPHSIISTRGQGGGALTLASVLVYANGIVNVRPPMEETYVIVDIVYLAE